MKKIIIGSLATAFVISGTIGLNAFAMDNGKSGKQLIGSQKAIEVALKQVTGTVESVELERKVNKTYYEVDIDGAKKKEFEVHVDAYTAKVLNVKESYDHDDDDYEAVAPTKLITEKEAITIAKKQASGNIKSIELDSDDGKWEYNIELRTKKGEAEVTIDASTGAVLELEFDDDHDDD